MKKDKKLKISEQDKALIAKQLARLLFEYWTEGSSHSHNLIINGRGHFPKK